VNGFPVTPPSRQTVTDKNPKKSHTNSSNKADWRAKHDEFLRTVRAARGEKVDDPPGTTNGENGAPRVPVGYIVCDYCGRNFFVESGRSAHTVVSEQKARIPRSANNAKALERMKARLKWVTYSHVLICLHYNYIPLWQLSQSFCFPYFIICVQNVSCAFCQDFDFLFYFKMLTI